MNRATERPRRFGVRSEPEGDRGMKEIFAAFRELGIARRTISIGAVLLLAMAAPALAQTPPSHAAAASPAHPAKARASKSTSLAADQFSSEQAAKAHCPGDALVWVNLAGSKAYHMSGNRYYGKTKHGAFMCQKEADQQGFHAAGHHAHGSAAKTANTKTKTTK
jgi:hypothetical protein